MIIDGYFYDFYNTIKDIMLDDTVDMETKLQVFAYELEELKNDLKLCQKLNE